jgi:hypothetical protein
MSSAVHDGTQVEVDQVVALPDFQLWAKMSDGRTRVIDMRPFLGSPVFRVLQDPVRFALVGLDDGVPTWENGSIDFAPERIVQDGVVVAERIAA